MERRARDKRRWSWFRCVGSLLSFIALQLAHEPLFAGAFGAASSQTGRISLDTPFKAGSVPLAPHFTQLLQDRSLISYLLPYSSDKRRSRTASQVPSALGSGHRAGSAGPFIGGEEFEGFEGEFRFPQSRAFGFGLSFFLADAHWPAQAASLEQGSSQRDFDAAAAVATLEQESLKFLSYASLSLHSSASFLPTHMLLGAPLDRYAKRHVSSDEDLLFSDIVPVASTNTSAAAQALYHLLALTTKGFVKVQQDEPYGDVSRRGLGFGCAREMSGVELS
jgi:hypothetical protein